jgi:hypothetical protein
VVTSSRRADTVVPSARATSNDGADPETAVTSPATTSPPNPMTSDRPIEAYSPGGIPSRVR